MSEVEPRPGLRLVPGTGAVDLAGPARPVLLGSVDAAVGLFLAHLPRWSRLPPRWRGRSPGPDTDPGAVRRAGSDSRALPDPAAMAAQGEALRQAADAVRRQHIETAEDLGPLWDTWRGPSADAVQRRVSALGRSAQGLVTELTEAADVLEVAAGRVADAVRDLAAGAAAARVDDPIGGLSLAEVDALIGAGLPAGAEARLRPYAADLEQRLRTFLTTCARTHAAGRAAGAMVRERLGAGPPITRS